MTAKPTTSADYAKVSDAIDDRLTRVWAVFNRIRDEQFNLTILSLIHYIASVIPQPAFIDLEVTDQGGDTMTMRSIGVASEIYGQLVPHGSYGGVASALTEVDGIEYVLMDEGDHGWSLDEDRLTEYAMSVEDYQLISHDFCERLGNKHSGQVRLWVGRALLALNSTYEGFIGEALDPLPDPEDPRAVAAWLARETAPEES